MGPGDVLELIGSAPERYNTVRAGLRYWGEGPTIKAPPPTSGIAIP